ncbi:MAG: energy transducer TonB [Chloroherpetonaceae bacterium]|nr:energy transducer TonB [Chloroherpetonaceae bacterium]
MRNTAISLGFENRWYAPRPHAFKMRDEYSRRMTHAFALTIVAVFSFLIAYMIQTIYQPIVEESQTRAYKEIVAEIDVVPPPPPVEKREAGQQTESLPNVSPVEPDVLADASPVNQAASQAIMRQVGNLVSTELKQAMAEVMGGLPTPSATAVGQDGSSLLSGAGSAGLRVNTSGGSFTAQGLGGGNELGFATGSNAGIGREGRSDLGLSGNGSLSLGTGKKMALKIEMSFKNMKVSGEGRKSEEIEAVVRSLTPALEDVYRVARGQQTEIKGLVVAEIFIQPDGTVRNARILKSAIRNSILENGMMQVLRRTKFGAIKGEIIQRVEIPYNFSADE